MSKPYRPSNGTEGILFMEAFCDRCARDAAFRRDPDNNSGCPIAAAAMAFNIADPGYPTEWVRDDDLGYDARCTAFEPEKAP